jgi:transcriptional regulator with XRE-family HTH domain
MGPILTARFDGAKQARYCSPVERAARKTTRKKTEPSDPNRLIGERVAVIRNFRGLTQVALAEKMRDQGIPWQRIVVAKLEIGKRPFVKVDELLALCLVLNVAPVDLLVPANLTDQPYRVTPKTTAAAENVRQWVRGVEPIFTASGRAARVAQIAAFVQFMPERRGKRTELSYLGEVQIEHESRRIEEEGPS